MARRSFEEHVRMAGFIEREAKSIRHLGGGFFGDVDLVSFMTVKACRKTGGRRGNYYIKLFI